MKLFGALALCVGLATATKMNKCEMIPKGGKRKTGSIKHLNQGYSQSPAAIQFLVDYKPELMELFAAGKDSPSLEMIGDQLMNALQFSNGVGDQQFGQIFRQIKSELNQIVKNTEKQLQKEENEMFPMFRDNSQRISHLFRDIAFSDTILDQIDINTDFKLAVYDAMNADILGDGLKSYKVFLDNHFYTMMPLIKQVQPKLREIHDKTVGYIKKLLNDEKTKGSYRQLVGELPQVYQFFNDNIDYIELSNVDKDLEEALGKEILLKLAEESGNSQIESMIKRHTKFIKKVMKDRAVQQQKEKAVKSVTDKNKELKENADNQAEFEKILKEKKEAGEKITQEMKEKIWAQVIGEEQEKAKEETDNQKKTGQKGAPSMTRYQHIVAIMSLMPDDLKDTIADMVQASCPELDLVRVDEMKQVIEEQPVNFIDQLIKELHDVCDMFGLIDPTKITTVNIEGVDVDFYAADWHQGQKVEW